VAGEHARVSDDEVARASETLRAELSRNRAPGSGDIMQVAGIIISALAAFSLGLVILCSLVSAVLVRGGIVTRLLGLAAVDWHGREIGRLRSLLRTALAWLPALVWLAYLGISPRVQGFVPTPNAPLVGMTITLVLLGAGAIWTIARPTRGPHDRLAGTWVVPR
jgi:hypothetical protein